MSLLKSVPEGLKPQECKCTKLRESPPVPYVPTKDEVQEEVSRLRNLEIKTTIEKDTTLNFPVWQENGMREAFLMHVTGVLNAIKKHGHFYDYEKAEAVHEEAKKSVESSRAGQLVYPCLTVPERSQSGFTRRRPEKPRRKLLQRPQTLSKKPGKPRNLSR
jgi:hypothetical protein